MASDEANRLARKLAALPEAPMRARVLVEYLSAAEDLTGAARTLDALRSRGRHAGPPFDVAMMAVADVLSGEMLDYELQARLYRETSEAGLDELKLLFLSTQGQEERRRAPGEDDQDTTLGHRKWMARASRHEVLARLLRRPEPEVMPNLLRNPRLTERDVVGMAARRPADPAVLRCIFGAPRWIARYSVKRALVLNPYTPPELSMRLLSFLNSPDLRLVRGMTNLPAPVRQAAGRLLE
jgi:hypothetical protein